MKGKLSVIWPEAEFDLTGLVRLFGLPIQPAPFDLLADGQPQGLWNLASVDFGDAVDQVWRQGDWELRCRYERLSIGVVQRSDRLIWHGEDAATIRRCHSSFILPPGDTQVESIASAWAREGQVVEERFHHEEITLRHVPGRTSEGTAPYIAIGCQGKKIAFHIEPVGNWTIRICPEQPDIDTLRPRVSLGLADEHLCLRLEQDTWLNLPTILITKDDPAALHRACLAHSVQRPVPVIYNTWYDRFDDLDPSRIRIQFEAAKRIGCEVFVIDAGWFGPWHDGKWPTIGDWVETTTGAFRGRMAEFAGEVRNAGMGFGLWIEPERFGRGAQVRREHPEWFPDADADFTRILLEIPEARAWVGACIGGLIERYRLAWMKIDFNFSLGDDASGHELMLYLQAWNALIDDLRSAYPQTLFEACSSGAMRLDLEVLRHFPVAYLSDNVNPWDMLSIAHGTWRRFPPGRLGRWAVMKRREDGLRASIDAGWESTDRVTVEFDMAVAFTGCLGFSGDIASLEEEELEALASLVNAYKEVGDKIQNSVGYLLTGARPIGDRTGWVATQQQNDGWNLVAGYRLGDCAPRFAAKLRDLRPEAIYLVRSILGKSDISQATGRELMEGGLTLASPTQNSATLTVVEPLI